MRLPLPILHSNRWRLWCTFFWSVLPLVWRVWQNPIPISGMVLVVILVGVASTLVGWVVPSSDINHTSSNTWLNPLGWLVTTSHSARFSWLLLLQCSARQLLRNEPLEIRWPFRHSELLVSIFHQLLCDTGYPRWCKSGSSGLPTAFVHPGACSPLVARHLKIVAYPSSTYDRIALPHFPIQLLRLWTIVHSEIRLKPRCQFCRIPSGLNNPPLRAVLQADDKYQTRTLVEVASIMLVCRLTMIWRPSTTMPNDPHGMRISVPASNDGTSLHCIPFPRLPFPLWNNSVPLGTASGWHNRLAGTISVL